MQSIFKCDYNYSMHSICTLMQSNFLKVSHVPESSRGSMASPFFTWSDSPVSELSSTFRSLLCMMMPSAGNRSPVIVDKRTAN